MLFLVFESYISLTSYLILTSLMRTILLDLATLRSDFYGSNELGEYSTGKQSLYIGKAFKKSVNRMYVESQKAE